MAAINLKKEYRLIIMLVALVIVVVVILIPTEEKPKDAEPMVVTGNTANTTLPNGILLWLPPEWKALSAEELMAHARAEVAEYLPERGVIYFEENGKRLASVIIEPLSRTSSKPLPITIRNMYKAVVEEEKSITMADFENELKTQTTLSGGSRPVQWLQFDHRMINNDYAICYSMEEGPVAGGTDWTYLKVAVFFAKSDFYIFQGECLETDKAQMEPLFDAMINSVKLPRP